MTKAAERIVFVNQNAGYLMIDIIHAQLATHPNLVLITGRLIERDIRLSPKVEVKKIVAYKRDTLLQRMWTWLAGTIQILWLAKTRFRNDHLYLVSNPPFATLIPWVCRNPFSLLIFDVYPDTLVEFKVIKPSSFIARWWEKKNREIFPRARRIFVLSEGMARRLTRYVDISRIRMVPLWTHAFERVTMEGNQFLNENRLQGKFVILYSGNFGRTHNLSPLLEVASRITDPDVIFAFVGQGEMRDTLVRTAAEKSLTNCRFFPWQTPAMLPFMMAGAALGVVALDDKASTLSVPSRAFNFLAASTPLLCLVHQESELANLVMKYQCGGCFSGREASEVTRYILALRSDPEKLMRLRQAAGKAAGDFTPDNAKSLVV